MKADAEQMVRLLIGWTHEQRLDWSYMENYGYIAMVGYSWAGCGDDRMACMRVIDNNTLVVNSIGEPMEYNGQCIGDLWDLLEDQRAKMMLGNTEYDRGILDKLQTMQSGL